MKSARRTWAVSFEILLFLFFLRLMTTSSRPKTPAAAPLPTNDIADPVVAPEEPAGDTNVAESRPSSRGPNGIGRALTALALAISLVPSVGLAMAGNALAAGTHNSGDKIDGDTVRLNWTGNGAPVDQKCGANADPGHLGYENGATADNYMLWIFNTDGGSTTGPVTISINGTTYSGANDGHQIVTPYIDPATIAHTD